MKLIYEINYQVVSKDVFKTNLERFTFNKLKDSKLLLFTSFDFKKVLKMVKKSNRIDFVIYENSTFIFRIRKVVKS